MRSTLPGRPIGRNSATYTAEQCGFESRPGKCEIQSSLSFGCFEAVPTQSCEPNSERLARQAEPAKQESRYGAGRPKRERGRPPPRLTHTCHNTETVDRRAQVVQEPQPVFRSDACASSTLSVPALMVSAAPLQGSISGRKERITQRSGFRIRNGIPPSCVLSWCAQE